MTSPSLENVLIAGACEHHIVELVFGLALSIVLLGVQASMIAQLLDHQRSIVYVELAVIMYVRPGTVVRQP